ncbi:MAG: translation initiation factor IF-2 subunit alpha [Candidatus Aenigmatarchaeota archaeon]
MVRKLSKFPAVGELVTGKVVRLNPFSALVKLEEYPGVEGMVHISEVARKWIKDIREFVKEGDAVVVKVLRVEEERGHVELSMKRVSKNEADAKLKEIKREQKAEKMLETAAKELGLSLDKAYSEVGFRLQEEFGEMWKGFQTSMTPDGREMLAKRGIPEKWIKAIAAVAEKTIELKETAIKGTLELKSPSGDGLEQIKSALDAVAKKGIEVHYISAPKYMLSFWTKDAKKGEKMIKEAAEEAIRKIAATGGEGRFERAD